MLRLPSIWFLTEGVTNPEGKLVKGGKQRDEPSDLLLARTTRPCRLVQFSEEKQKTMPNSCSESIQSRKAKFLKTAWQDKASVQRDQPLKQPFFRKNGMGLRYVSAYVLR